MTTDTRTLSDIVVVHSSDLHIDDAYTARTWGGDGTAPLVAVLETARGVGDGPGGGRKALGEEAARNLPTIRRKCPDDFDALARRVGAAVRVQ